MPRPDCLSADDLLYGYAHGRLHPSTVIEWAAHEVDAGSRHPEMLKIVALSRDEPDRLNDLKGSAAPDPSLSTSLRARKWLYLLLKAAYEKRRGLADPLGVVEQLYADFGYPPTVEQFVRYMPLRHGDAAGEDALIGRWADCLHRERQELRAKTAAR